MFFKIKRKLLENFAMEQKLLQRRYFGPILWELAPKF